MSRKPWCPRTRTAPFFGLWDIKVLDIIPSVAVAFSCLPSSSTSCCTGRGSGSGSRRWAAILTRRDWPGIDVDRTRILVLALMGAVAGLAGVVFLGFREAIDTITGDSFLLPVIAAVIIGGTPLSGGRGTIFGAVIGALIIVVIQSGILFLGVDAKWSIFVTGSVIIVAVAVDQLVRRKRSQACTRCRGRRMSARDAVRPFEGGAFVERCR